MIQYRPAYRAHLFTDIDSYVSRDACQEVVCEVRRYGLDNLDVDYFPLIIFVKKPFDESGKLSSTK